MCVCRWGGGGGTGMSNAVTVPRKELSLNQAIFKYYVRCQTLCDTHIKANNYALCYLPSTGHFPFIRTALIIF